MNINVKIFRKVLVIKFKNVYEGLYVMIKWDLLNICKVGQYWKIK